VRLSGSAQYAGFDAVLIWKPGDKVIQREPARTFWQRLQSAFFGLFDLDDQL